MGSPLDNKNFEQGVKDHLDPTVDSLPIDGVEKLSKDLFKIQKELGKGSYGVVHLVT